MVTQYIFRTAGLSALVVSLAAFSGAQDTPQQQEPGQQQIQPQPGITPDAARGLDPDRPRGLDRAEEASPEGQPRVLDPDRQAARLPFDADRQGRLERLRHHYALRYEIEGRPELQELDRDVADLTWRTWDDAVRDWRIEDAYWRLSDQYWRDAARRNEPEAAEYWQKSEAYWRDSDMFWRDYLGMANRQLQTRLRLEGESGAAGRADLGTGRDRAELDIGAGAGIETDIED